MKVGLYARVSDDKKNNQGEKIQDVQRQVQILTEYVNRTGEAFEVYIDDGKSAFTEDWNSRPAFKQLINDCRRRFIQKIYIEDMTRFSRRLDVGVALLKELGTLGVQLISLKEGEFEATSSGGWMKSSILLLFAEWDSRIKSEKVKEGMKRAKESGKRIGGRNPTPPKPLKPSKNK